MFQWNEDFSINKLIKTTTVTVVVQCLENFKISEKPSGSSVSTQNKTKSFVDNFDQYALKEKIISV